MAGYNTISLARSMGFAAVTFGFFGLLLFWWVPFGTVLSLAGLALGLIGWLMTAKTPVSRRWLFWGSLLSFAALALNLIIAAGMTEPNRWQHFIYP